MQRTFFDVTPVELGQLGPELAVWVLREMLWAEVHNIGIPITETDIPFSITDADGGVDAEVRVAPQTPGNGLIFPPRTSYQVKAGNFPLNATTVAQIEELIVTPAAARRRREARAEISGSQHSVADISPRVRACLDAGGAFVTMLFGSDNIDIEEDATENAIRSFLVKIDPKYAGANVKVWRQSKICSLLRQFPGVSLQLKNLRGFPLLSHSQWSARLDMRPNFVSSPEQHKIIADLRGAIRDDTEGLIHIRLIGEPGIGKTRLMLETLRSDDLHSLTLYAEKGSRVDDAVFTAIAAASDARIVLVVDECGPDLRSYLTRSLGGIASKLTIVSVYQDQDEGDRASEYKLFYVPGLPVEEIEAILKSYGVDPSYTKAWAELCDKSPRVAHVVGRNLREHPADPLQSDGTSRIWVRYLAGDEDENSESYRKRRLVLSTLALFKRFGWSATVRDSTYQIHKLILLELDPGLSKAEFGGIVEKMVARKVLQGDHFLYITPRALHIKLWIDWWNQYGAAVNVIELIPKLPDQLRHWFGEMIEYASATPISRQLVTQLLGPTGLYADAEWLKTKDGARFFFSLSLADPFRAVQALERTVGQMSREELLQFGPGRRDIVWTLEGTALHSDLFRPSARLLLALAEAENETWSNNATGVFADLFSLGYGEVAPTGLAPEHRLPVLTDALSQNEARAQIALNAFDTSLNVQSITRRGGDQPFRLNERVQRWSPKTYGEWFAAYRLYWTTLRSALAELPAQLQARGADVLLSHARELMQIESLREEIIDTIAQLSALPDYDNRKLITTIERLLTFDATSLPGDVTSRLEAIRDQLVGASFNSRIKRYAGMEPEYGRRSDKGGKGAREIQELAREALAEPGELRAELKWLVTDDARNGFRFGYELGQLDVPGGAWGDLVTAWNAAGGSASDYFIGGYLRAVFERDQPAWEGLIRELANSSTNILVVPGVIWRSGINDNIAMLLLELAQRGKIPPERFDLFSMGRGDAGISDDVFSQWLNFLIGVETFEAASTALNLSYMSHMGGRHLTASQIRRVLTLPALFGHEGKQQASMLAFDWLELSKVLIQQDASSEIVVLQTLIEGISNSDAITSSLGPEGERYLDELVSRHPVETWRAVSKLINPPMDVRGFVVTRWLRGDQGFGSRNPGPMRHIPRDEIRKWVDANPDQRAGYVASMAPKDFDAKTWSGSLVREILCRYGDSDAVRSAVMSNFLTGGWWGPASSHYGTEKDALLEIKASETDPNALRWLNDAIAATDANMTSAKIEEEARGF
jgi:hypothetical protein